MSRNELLEHYKRQSTKAQYYLERYIDELRLHFALDDFHIIKILEKQVKTLKSRLTSRKLFWFFNKD